MSEGIANGIHKETHTHTLLILTTYGNLNINKNPIGRQIEAPKVTEKGAEKFNLKHMGNF